MSRRSEGRKLWRRFGHPENWVIPTADIERVMTEGVCRHTYPSIEDCRECFTTALLERQLAILAERLGCTPEDAAAVGARLVRERQGGV